MGTQVGKQTWAHTMGNKQRQTDKQLGVFVYCLFGVLIVVGVFFLGGGRTMSQ